METWDKFFYRKKKLDGSLVPRRVHKSHLVLTIAETVLFGTKASWALIKPSEARPHPPTPTIYSIIGHLLLALRGPIYLSHISYHFSSLSKKNF